MRTDLDTKAPTVSVIITCFNYAAYVAQAIESALAQTFTDVEIIVVDDGSTDGSAEVIARYEGRVRSIYQENQGTIAACLAGLGRSSGRFIIFLDADDLLEPTALSEAAPFFDESVSKIQFMLQPIDADGIEIGRPFPRPVKAFGSAALVSEISRRGCYDTPPTSGNIYRRDVYTQLGSLSYDYGIDGVAYLLAPFVGRVHFIEKALGKYRIHGANLSGTGSMLGTRMQRDSEVFAKRLAHLSELLDKNGIDASAIRPSGEFQYRLERLVQSRLVQGQKIPAREGLAYLRSIVRELRGARRAIYLSFGALSVFAPRKLALWMVRVRNDPAALPGLRSIASGR
jgi:glycosyltransferase involved in cell wall biosynthesis